jgi:hypothetical protein
MTEIKKSMGIVLLVLMSVLINSKASAEENITSLCRLQLNGECYIESSFYEVEIPQNANISIHL